jgi:hypothetical protein
MSDEEGAHWYMHLNQRLLRIQRIGSHFGNVSFCSLEGLRETLLPPGSSPGVVYRVDPDDCSLIRVEEDEGFKEIEEFLAAARLLSSEEERKALLKKSSKGRVDMIMRRKEAAGRPPWYVMTPEEIELVGLELPYSLVTHPDPEFIRILLRKRETD